MADIAALQSRVRNAEQELARTHDESSQSVRELVELMSAVERMIKTYRGRIAQQSTTIERQGAEIAKLERDRAAFDAERANDKKLLTQISSDRDKLGACLDSLLTAIESRQPSPLNDLVKDIRERIQKLGEQDPPTPARMDAREGDRSSALARVSPSISEDHDAEAGQEHPSRAASGGVPHGGDEPEPPLTEADSEREESGETTTANEPVDTVEADSALDAIDRRLKRLFERPPYGGVRAHPVTAVHSQTEADTATEPDRAADASAVAARAATLRQISASPDDTEYRFWFWPRADAGDAGQGDGGAKNEPDEAKTSKTGTEPTP